MHSDESLSVSELNNYIRDVLTSGFPAAVWVCGEIQELRDKKHLYFNLSEKDAESNSITAKIGVSIWANVRPKIEAILQKSENAFVLKDDIEVKLLCKVDFYPPFGQVRLIVEGIDPTYTLGKIAQDRARLINLLRQKGVLEKNKQLQLPILPLSIGLITSYDSAAYHDFVEELKKSGYAFSVKIIDSIMQGKTTETSVASALKKFNKMGGIDVIVITRGGGSITDLSAFDSQLIAETIAASKVPVISGIGHEINTTITDLASHTFAKTPTATAGILIACIQEFWKSIEDKGEIIVNLAQEAIVQKRNSVRNQALQLRQSSLSMFKDQQALITRMIEVFKRVPASIIKNSRKQTITWQQDFKKTIHLRLIASKNKIAGYQKVVDVADPKNMLKKGFSISRDLKGKVIKSTKGLKVGTSFKTQFSDGLVISDVKEIKKGVYES